MSFSPDPAQGKHVFDLDRQYVFHSWSAQGALNPMCIAEAEGSYVWDYDGNKWLEQLMHHDDNNMRLTALRLLEVRRAYASGQFDFGGMHDLAVAELTKENDRLMADYVKDSMDLPDAGRGEDGMNH